VKRVLRTTRLIVRVQLGVLVAISCPVTHATGPQLPPAPKFDSVPQLDEALAGLRKVSWALYSAPYPAHDVRDRSIAQDVNQWLLTPEHEARLEALRARAQSQSAARDPAAARAVFTEAALRVHQERCLAQLLGTYWYYQDLISRHQARLEALQEQLPHDDRAARQHRLAPLLRQWADAFTAAMTTDTFPIVEAAAERLSAAAGLVFEAYNKERGELATQLSTQNHAQGRAARTQTTEVPCQVEPAKTSGKELPKLAPDNAAPETVYPSVSRHSWFEGYVVVDASVSVKGCAEKAAVVRSSGVDELDDAALRWALQAHYLPGERDHLAVDGVLRFAVRFKLSEAPGYPYRVGKP